MCGEHPERGTCDESRPVPRFLASATMLFEDIGNVGAVIHNALVPHLERWQELRDVSISPLGFSMVNRAL